MDAATVGGRAFVCQKLRRDRVGRIKEGYEADLAILDADPLADVRAVAQVYGVLTNGRFLLSEDLTEVAPR